MTKHLLTTLTDSEKRRQYFNMIKADKKLSKKIIASVVAVVTVIALACVIVPKINEYNPHKYDGMWLLNNDIKKGFVKIEGKDGKYVKDFIAKNDDGTWYDDLYAGKRDGDTITYTFHAKLSYHYYDKDLYTDDDYDVEDNYERVVSLKMVSKDKISIDDKYVFVKLKE